MAPPSVQNVPKSPFFQPSSRPSRRVATTPGGTTSVVESDDSEHTSTIFGTTGNLVNAIFGAGIVGIAYAIRQTGLVAGIFMILLCAVMTEKSLRLLIETAKHIHVPSYELLCEATFGQFGFYFISLSMFVMSYGGMIAYLLVVKDTLPSLLGVGPEESMMRNWVLAGSSLLIMFPISCQRDMADLAKTSTVSVGFYCIMVSIIAYFSPISDNIASTEGGLAEVISTSIIHPQTFFIGLGVLSFAFVCQHAAFVIAGSLRNPTRDRWSNVTKLSVCICATLAMTIGVSGYLGFGDKTEGDVLNSFNILPEAGNENVRRAANVGRALLCTAMFCVYPLESFVARHVTVVFFFRGRMAHEGDDHTVLARWDRRVGMTFLLYILALVPALLFQDLGGVLAFTGSIGGSCLSYIGPGCTYLAVHGDEFYNMVNQVWNFEDGVPFYKHFTYYLFLIPLWNSIARLGKDILTEYQEREALKTPHWNRIGEVRHKQKQLQMIQQGKGLVIRPPPPPRTAVDGLGEMDSLPLLRSSSFTDGKQLQQKKITVSYGAAAISSGGGMTNRSIAAAIAAKQQIVEDDPQDEESRGSDFIVAILFILFGVIAAVAGLVSIYVGS